MLGCQGDQARTLDETVFLFFFPPVNDKVFQPQRSVRPLKGIFGCFNIPEWFVHQEMSSGDNEGNCWGFCIIVILKQKTTSPRRKLLNISANVKNDSEESSFSGFLHLNHSLMFPFVTAAVFNEPVYFEITQLGDAKGCVKAQTR